MLSLEGDDASLLHLRVDPLFRCQIRRLHCLHGILCLHILTLEVLQRYFGESLVEDGAHVENSEQIAQGITRSEKAAHELQDVRSCVRQQKITKLRMML